MPKVERDGVADAWVERETERLRRRFDRLLAGLPASLAAASPPLCSRIKIGGLGLRHWADQFSPLVRLYPLLQAQGSSRAELALARKAAVAHLALLAHAFIEDRRLDRQIELLPAEALLSQRLLLEGLARLRRLAFGAARLEAWVRRLTDRFAWAQAAQYDGLPRQAGATEPSLARAYGRLAAGRSAFGSIAVVAWAIAGGRPAATIRSLLAAFDDLALGLQLIDDLTDWPDDLLNARPNFLALAWSARRRRTLAPPKTRQAAIRHGAEFMRLGIFGQAFTEATRAFDRALAFQRRRGCPRLARLIAARQAHARRMAEDWLAAMARQLGGAAPGPRCQNSTVENFETAE